MKPLKRAWSYLLTEPFGWIFYCFFQPKRFRGEIEISGYFKLKRVGPTLRMIIPLFLCFFPFLLVSWSIDFLFDISDILYYLHITFWLFIGLAILSILGGITLSIARGITLGIIWSILYIFITIFYSVDINASILLAILVGFSIIGGIIFGTVFGSTDELSGDIAAYIVWTTGVFIVRVFTVDAWSFYDFLFATTMVVGFAIGLVSFVMKGSKRSKGEKVAKKSILWGSIGGIPLAILLGISASTSPDVTYPSVIFTIVGYALFCFFGAVCYVLGYSRLLLYPFSCFSTLRTYLDSRKKPSQVFTYLHRCSLYWDECVFPPLLGLRRTLLIAALQDEDGRSAIGEVTFILVERPQQIGTAQAVSQELAIRDLEKRRTLHDIAEAHTRLAVLLPQEVALIDPQWVKPFHPLDDASHDAERYLSPLSRKAQRRALQSMIANLKKIKPKTASEDARLNERLARVVKTWLTVAKQEEERLKKASPVIDQIDNPFNPGQVLKPRDSLFVGRHDLVQQLEEALSLGDRRPTFLLNGERRMGKTSALKQLPNLLGSRYLPIFYDLQTRGVSSSTVTFLAVVAREICEVMRAKGMRVEKLEYMRLQEANQKNDAAVYYIFEEWFKGVEWDLEQEDKTLLLTFDEFEKLGEAGSAMYLDLDLLLDWFRSVIQNHPRLALLFSGVRAFSEMGPNWVNHFVNVQTLRVSFLRPAEVRRLITQPDDPDFSSERPFNADVVEEIIRVTTGHPFLVQAICSTLINYLNAEERTQASISDVRIAIKQVLDNWKDYFLDLWMRTDDNQRRCLMVMKDLDLCSPLYIKQRTSLDNRTAQLTLQNLLKRDLVLSENGNYRIAVPIFREWIERSSQLSEQDLWNLTAGREIDLPARSAPRPALHPPNQSQGNLADIPFFPHPAVNKVRVGTEKRAALDEEMSPSSRRQRPAWSPQTHSVISHPKHLISTIVILLLVFEICVFFIAPTSNVMFRMTAITKANPTAIAATATASVITANPNPYSSGGRLILYDPLKNNNNDLKWQEDGNCTFKNDGYHVNQRLAGWFTLCATRSAGFNNFAFEVVMKILTGDGGGVLFHADTTYGKYSAYTLFILVNGQYSLNLYKNGGYAKTLASGVSSAINRGLNQTNLVAVVTRSNITTVYVNHQQIANISDDTYSQGQIGFIADAASNPADVAYTSAKIWAL